MASFNYIGGYAARYGPYPQGGAPAPTAPVFGQPITASSTILLAWTGPAGSYTLQRAPVASNGSIGAFTTIYTGSTPSYQDMGLAPITTYAYRVLVTVNGMASAYSTVLQAITAGSTPAQRDYIENDYITSDYIL